MTALANDQTPHPLHRRGLPFRQITGQNTFVIRQPVRLHIRLAQNHQAHLIAQLHEAWVVRIMRRAHGVEIRLFHQTDVIAHRRLVHDIAGDGIPIVPVDAANFQRATVECEFLVLECHLPETNPHRDGFNGFASLQQLDDSGVKFRRFKRPLLRRVENLRRGQQLDFISSR